MLLLLIILLIFSSVMSITYVLVPTAFDKFRVIHQQRTSEVSRKLENLFFELEKKKIAMIFTLVPIALAITGFLLFHGLLGALIGLGVGLALPNIFVRVWEKRRKGKFEEQLLDGLLILSGSLKAGLSFLQSLEVMVEDSPAPLSQEFGWVVKEVKMGMSLEASLRQLNTRMYSEELTMLISSILVAEETGGDITKIFNRLATSIRKNRRLKENIKTLTLQGKLQGIVMSILPFVFIWWVITFNRRHFDIMLNSEIGRMLIIGAAGLQIVGLFLIYKFSKLRL